MAAYESSGAGPASSSASDIYHDIYDFSLFPVSLGDIINWGVKSALRAAAVGRKKVHVHLVIDPKKSGFSPFQASSYLIDLFAVEAVPAFYSHPYFCGLSIYRAREDFQTAFTKIAQGDEISLGIYREHESQFQDRKNYDRLGEYFRTCCSSQQEINDYYQRTGTFPRIGYLEDCLVDWHALQAQFPEETFWVAMQFRLRQLDGGMPVEDEGLRRDASFLTWQRFIKEAAKRYPSVRFVLLGRLQEKPLELLRAPNVVAMRTLGMNLGHEITALLHADLYMGSPSGFASVAHFSDVPYDIFNCTEAGCKYYGIPFGTKQLPFAGPGQRLHYGEEEVETLLECLREAISKNPKKPALSAAFETNRASSTDRFFIHDAQSDAELAHLFSGGLKRLTLTVERGDYAEARSELTKMAEIFPGFIPQWAEFIWLSDAVDFLLRQRNVADQARRNELLVEISRFCRPARLIRRSGWRFDLLPDMEGFRTDGWCEKKTKLVLAPGGPGDFVVLQIGRLAGSEPIRLSARINRQEPLSFVLLNEYAVLELPVLESNIPTEIVLEADQGFRIKPGDEKEYAYLVEGAALVSGLAATQTSYVGDKRDPREKIASGIYPNGAAGSLARIRIDNPFPDDTEIAIRMTGTVPSRSLRKGQSFRLQVNRDEAHQVLITGKRFEATVPCSGHSRHLSILLQFRNRNESETIARENRAVIQSIQVIRAAGRKAAITSGSRSAIRYLFDNLKSKLSKKYPKPV